MASSMLLVFALLVGQAGPPPSASPAEVQVPGTAGPVPGTEVQVPGTEVPGTAGPVPGTEVQVPETRGLVPETDAGIPRTTPEGEFPHLGFVDALRQANAQNLDLVAAKARLDRSAAAVRQAWAGYLPTLTVAGSYTRNSVAARIQLPEGYFIRDVGAVPPGTPGPQDPSRPVSPENPPGSPTPFVLFPSGFREATVQARDQLGAQADVRQAVFAPTLWAVIHSAHLGERSAGLQLQSARQQVLFGGAQLYLAAAGLKAAVAVQERLLVIQREQTRLAEERFRAGTAPRIDVLRAQIDLTRAEQDLVRTRNALAAAKSSLAVLLGREPDFDVSSAEALPSSGPPVSVDVDALLARAVQERPDLQAARVGVEQAQTVHRSVLSSYFPTLGLSGQYRISNVAGFAGRNDVWALVAALTWTLWDGGLREAQLHAAKAGIQEAEAQATASRLRVEDDVRRALYELASARANREKAQQQQALAQENLRLVQLAYASGAASSLDQSIAISQLAAAELTALNERVSAYLAALAVLRAAGLFDSPEAVFSRQQ